MLSLVISAGLVGIMVQIFYSIEHIFMHSRFLDQTDDSTNALCFDNTEKLRQDWYA